MSNQVKSLNLSNTILLIFTLAIVSLVICVVSLNTVLAQQDITLIPEIDPIGLYQVFDINMRSHNFSNIFAVAFDLDFDSNLVEFVSASEKDFFNPGCQTSFLYREVGSGKIVVGLTRLGVSCGGVSGSGEVASFTFRSLDRIGQNTFSFSNYSICELKEDNCEYRPGLWGSVVVAVTQLTRGAITDAIKDGLVLGQQVRLHPQGTLVKYQNDPTVYLIEGGKKRPIPSWAVFQSRFINRPIVEISDNEFYNDGMMVDFSSGTLLKAFNDPGIYLVLDNGTLYPFRTPDEFFKFGYRFEQVREVDKAELVAIPMSQAIQLKKHPNNTFIKYPDDLTVYRIVQGFKQPVPSMAVLRLYIEPADILVVSREFEYSDGAFLRFPDGTLIKGQGSTVFRIENGQKRPFSSYEKFLDESYRPEMIAPVEDENLDLHQTGTAI